MLILDNIYNRIVHTFNVLLNDKDSIRIDNAKISYKPFFFQIQVQHSYV